LSASGFDDKLAFGFGPGPAIIHFLAISSVLRFGRATDRDTTNQPLLFILPQSGESCLTGRSYMMMFIT
jgi:hypothetical protein